MLKQASAPLKLFWATTFLLMSLSVEILFHFQVAYADISSKEWVSYNALVFTIENPVGELFKATTHHSVKYDNDHSHKFDDTKQKVKVKAQWTELPNGPTETETDNIGFTVHKNTIGTFTTTQTITHTLGSGSNYKAGAYTNLFSGGVPGAEWDNALNGAAQKWTAAFHPDQFEQGVTPSTPTTPATKTAD